MYPIYAKHIIGFDKSLQFSQNLRPSCTKLWENV